MDKDNGARLMEEALAAALKKMRYDFQEKYPHYTPPPDAPAYWWTEWVRAKLTLHGVQGFRERFPKHAAVVETQMKFGEPMTDDIADKLRTLSYA